jgi:hypothetical protein
MDKPPAIMSRKPKEQFADGDLVKVAYAQNQSEAEFLQGLLLEEGVPSGRSTRRCASSRGSSSPSRSSRSSRGSGPRCSSDRDAGHGFLRAYVPSAHPLRGFASTEPAMDTG